MFVDITKSGFFLIVEFGDTQKRVMGHWFHFWLNPLFSSNQPMALACLCSRVLGGCGLGSAVAVLGDACDNSVPTAACIA